MDDDNHEPVTERDRQLWASATSLRDVAELTAQWLEGTVSSQPGYRENWGPAEETIPIIEPLCAANRAGFLTDQSQPGFAPTWGNYGEKWAQRAAVSGFIHRSPLLKTIKKEARRAGLIVLVRRPGWTRKIPRRTIVATTHDERPCTWWHIYENGYLDDPLCPPQAAKDIDAAHHVVLVDPRFESTNTLWDILSATPTMN